MVIALGTNKDKIFEDFLFRLEPSRPTDEERYKQLRLKVIKFFAWKGCDDNETLADKTISHLVRNLVAGEEISKAVTYSVIYAIASNVYKEYLQGKRRRELLPGNLAELPSKSEDVQDCRKECLQKLPLEKLKLIREYYLADESKERLAQSLGISLNALRLLVYRIKSQLRSCHQNCIKEKTTGD
jgi:DNA-directed RNA polymerase specialized sigma24 family protein